MKRSELSLGRWIVALVIVLVASHAAAALTPQTFSFQNNGGTGGKVLTFDGLLVVDPGPGNSPGDAFWGANHLIIDDPLGGESYADFSLIGGGLFQLTSIRGLRPPVSETRPTVEGYRVDSLVVSQKIDVTETLDDHIATDFHGVWIDRFRVHYAKASGYHVYGVTVAVPEPGSLALLGFGAGVLLARRRRGR